MEEQNRPREIYIDAIKQILDAESMRLGLKVDSVVDFGDPVVVFRPDDAFRTHRYAVGYFRLTRENRIKRRFLWNKLIISDIATIAIYKKGSLDIFVDDAIFNPNAESIAQEFQQLTGKTTKVYLKPDK